jgi:hypothetical protein
MQRVGEKIRTTRNGWKFPESKRSVRKVERYQMGRDKRTDNAMTNRKRTKGQTTIYKTLQSVY